MQYIVENNYTWEKRNNSIEDEETYTIYWNTNKGIINKSDRLYCSQKITIILRKAVNEEIITYEIGKIILTDN